MSKSQKLYSANKQLLGHLISIPSKKGEKNLDIVKRTKKMRLPIGRDDEKKLNEFMLSYLDCIFIF